MVAFRSAPRGYRRVACAAVYRTRQPGPGFIINSRFFNRKSRSLIANQDSSIGNPDSSIENWPPVRWSAKSQRGRPPQRPATAAFRQYGALFLWLNQHFSNRKSGFLNRKSGFFYCKLTFCNRCIGDTRDNRIEQRQCDSVAYRGACNYHPELQNSSFWMQISSFLVQNSSF